MVSVCQGTGRMIEELEKPQVEDAEDEAFGVTERLIAEVREAVEAGDKARIDAALDPLHPADIAHLIELIDPRERRALLGVWKGGMDGDILSELDDGLREDIIETLAPAELAEVMRDLETDDVVDLVEYLDEEQQGAVLQALDAPERVAVEKALAYPEESAGRHMQVEIVRAPEHWTVGEAIDYLRSGVELPDQFYHVMLVDPRAKAAGYVTLGRILSAPRDVPLRDLAEDSFRTFQVDQPAADVAQAINHYHMITAPVVDDDDRLVGVITIDDAMTLLDEEHEEDILRLAGVGEGSISDNWFETAWQRFPWLFVNLLTAILASVVISFFEGTIVKMVALAVLMPIVASQGGNAATQGLAVAVRALATKSLTQSNVWRVIRREILQGLANGAIFALLIGAISWLWFGGPLIGVVIGLAMIINLFAAALAGLLIPFGLDKMGFDPALASGAFVTTVTDVVGFFAFLWLAGVILL